MRRFREVAAGALPVYLAGADADADADVEYDPFEVGLRAVRGALSGLIGRGRRHRRFLSAVDTRIVVSGIRGKSSTTRRLDDVFNRRGYDVLTKITGNHPHLIRNGDVIPIDRQGHTPPSTRTSTCSVSSARSSGRSPPRTSPSSRTRG
jgi:hypothetical protein